MSELIFFSSGVLLVIIVVEVGKRFLRARKKVIDLHLIRRATFKQWSLIRTKAHDLNMRELSRISGLSRATIYRCLKLERQGTHKQNDQFRRGTKTLNSLIVEINKAKAEEKAK